MRGEIQGHDPMTESRPPLALRDLFCALAVGLAALFLYLATLQPDFGGPEDTPKFQFVGHVLGTAHPPGYPLYVVLSHLFVQLPIGTIAYRANLFSAVMAALACALAYVMARQIGAGRVPSLVAAAALATGASFWRSAVFAEVYSLAAVMVALSLTLLLSWGAHGGPGRLLAAVFAFGLGLGNHLTIVGMVPAFALYVLLRNRRALTVRVVVAAGALLAVAVSQYAFIIVRTRQEAPYLESRASSLSELAAIVTAQRFSEQRFAFGPSALLTIQVPVIARVCRDELGIAGVLLLATGLAAAVRQRNLEAGLVTGAAAGMLVMVANLYGDFAGFLTPVIALLWPLTALGISAIADTLRSWSTGFFRARFLRGTVPLGRVLATVVLAATAALPLANLAANYRYADQSTQYAAARFLRRVYADLPPHAGVVVEDYGQAMALQYFTLTGRRGKQVVRVEYDAADVRRAWRQGRRVFAFAGAATVLGAEGLLFGRADVTGTPLDTWLRDLEPGTVVVGAAAHAAAPFDPAALGQSTARGPGRARSYEAFVLIAQRPGAAWQAGDKPISWRVESSAVSPPLPPLAGPLILSADSRGARIELAGRTIADMDAGVVLGVFDENGRLLRSLEFLAGDVPRVPFLEALYELKAEVPCTNLTETWSGTGNVLSTGSWVASLPDTASVVVETAFPRSAGVTARSRALLGDGEIRTVEAATSDETTFSTEMTRTGEARPVFRLALDRPSAMGRARVRPGGTPSVALLCPHHPVRSLFSDGVESTASAATLGADYESEAYFGAGWSAVQRTATGPVRRGEDRATLLLPLETQFTYHVAFDLAGGRSQIDIAANGAAVGTCELGTATPCEVTLVPAVLRQGVNTLTMSVRPRDVSAPQREDFIFRAARISRR